MTTIVVVVLAALVLTACDLSDSPDFEAADLERLNFAADELPDMEYQPDSSGPGAFSRNQEEEAEEEGGSGLELLARLNELGLEEDYVSQFFAANRDAELGFVESISFLFEDEEGAEDAVGTVREANARNVKPAEEIEAPELGEQAFGLRGEFDGFLVYSYGWRVGDVIQIASVSPADQDAGPQSTLELAEQLEAKAEE